jgi:outer membrane lipoprotein-sorting protein
MNRYQKPAIEQRVSVMSKRRLILFLSVVVVMTLSCSAFAAEFQADMKMEGGEETVIGKIFVSGSLMRQEMDVPGGGKSIGIVDGAKNIMYVIMPQEKMYMEFPNAQIVLGDEDIEGWLSDEADLKKIGTETIEGYKCDKYEVNYKDPDRQAMGSSVIWIAQKLNFPIRGVTEDEDGKVTVTYTNIKEGPQDKALFEIPKDYQKFAF